MAVTSATTIATEEPPPPLRGNRDFRRLWFSAGFSLLGAKAYAFVGPLLVLWQDPKDVVQAGLVGFATLLPQFAVQLPAGVMVDRWDRRRIMITCDVVGFLAIGSVTVALLLNALTLPHVIAVAFVEGSAAVTYGLCERGAVRSLVRPEHLSAAMSQNEARGQALGMVGQPLASFLLGVTRWVPFGYAAVAHLLSLCTLLSIKKEFQGARAPGPRRLRAELAEGFAWMWRQRALRVSVGLIAVTNILFQMLAFSVIVIVRTGGHSEWVVGLIGGAAGVGGLLGALSASWWMKRITLPMIMTGTFASWAVLMPLMALTGMPVLLGLLLSGISFTAGVMNVAGMVYLVRIAPEQLLGRAASVAGLVAAGANSLGPLTAGLVLTACSTTDTVLGAGAVMVVVALLSAASPSLRGARTDG
jgi:MFS family permease